MRRCERLPAPPGCHQEGTWLERTGCGLGQEVLNPFEIFPTPISGHITKKQARVEQGAGHRLRVFVQGLLRGSPLATMASVSGNKYSYVSDIGKY